jgi:phage/plasmid-like protein (TIGR03299 family)
LSHQLEQHGNQTSFVSARLDAWHRLGTVLPDVFDAQTALDTAHLSGWNVHKEEMTTVGGIIVPEKFANVRTNPYTGDAEVLGVSGTQYVPVQNEEHVELLNTLVDESGAIFETAGSLNGGKDVFVTMKLPETMKIGGVDEVEVNIAALNNHSGDKAFRLLTTPVRIVCANTQKAAIRNAWSNFNIHHTKSATGRIEEARQALGLTFKYVDDFEAEAEKMIQETMKEAEFAKLMDELVGVPNLEKNDRTTKSTLQAREDLLYCFADSPTSKGIRNTKWGAYQAVTEWTDHMYPVRGDDKDIKRALRTASGGNDKMKLQAWNLLAV